MQHRWRPAVLLLGAVCCAQAMAMSVREEVLAREQAFADSMANRDFAAFETFLSDAAVFFSGDNVLRGKEAVAAHWKGYFDTPQAPFSWSAQQVEVLQSGELAHSSGPVFNSAGQLIGQFNSVWRKEHDGQWRIVFDKGQSACGPAPSE